MSFRGDYTALALIIFSHCWALLKMRSEDKRHWGIRGDKKGPESRMSLVPKALTAVSMHNKKRYQTPAAAAANP